MGNFKLGEAAYEIVTDETNLGEYHVPSQRQLAKIEARIKELLEQTAAELGFGVCKGCAGSLNKGT